MKNLKALLIFAAFYLSGCTNSVVVEGSIPTPLVKKVPARVGVYYDESFSNFKHTEALDSEGTWKIDLGEKNLTFFQNLMGSMFVDVKQLSSPNPSAEELAGLDAVVVPSIEKYGFLTPALSGLKFFSASIHYKISMTDESGRELADWTIVGYGKSEGGAFGSSAAVGKATMLAIRDGGARISIGLPKQPKVAQWIEQQEGANNVD